MQLGYLGLSFSLSSRMMMMMMPGNGAKEINMEMLFMLTNFAVQHEKIGVTVGLTGN